MKKPKRSKYRPSPVPTEGGVPLLVLAHYYDLKRRGMRGTLLGHVVTGFWRFLIKEGVIPKIQSPPPKFMAAISLLA